MNRQRCCVYLPRLTLRRQPRPRPLPPPRQACHELEPTYNPRITFVVVQKRHATRLFPTDRGGEDRSGNTLPGTVRGVWGGAEAGG